ncbi:MAG: GNAT family N-acetyltransferase [archaeon]|nr:GNAT family N-acetyltransferase [archaeon]
MKLKLLTDLSNSETIKNEWDNLVELSNKTIFSKFNFIKNWADVYSDIAPLEVYLAYEDGQLVGIAPFAREDGVLKFAGGIDYKVAADYCDFIVNPLHLDKVMNEFSQILTENHSVLHEIPKNSPALDYFRRNNFGRIENSSICSDILLPPDWESYLRGLDNSRIKKMRYFLNRLERESGEITYELVEDKTELGKKMEDFFEMHQREWADMRGQKGCFADDEKHTRFRKFHKTLAGDFLDDKNLYLSFLKVDQNIFAVEYSFVDKNSIYGYLGAINPEFHQYSPGRIRMNFVLKDAILKGIKKYDFLRGDEPYKEDVYRANWSNNFKLIT